MTVTPASFRADFPEFANTTTYPNALVAFYITLAGNLLPVNRWGAILDQGTELFVAHNCTLEALAQAAAANGAPPGIAKGPIASQSVDKVSVSYDVGDAAELDAGHWNNTTYGQRFVRLARQMGAGPVQIGGGGCGLGPLSSANAWPGPWPWNFPNQSG